MVQRSYYQQRKIMKLYIRTADNCIIPYDKIVRFDVLDFFDELGAAHQATIEDRRAFENWLTTTNEDSDLETDWDFVERYYPNYSSSSHILEADILTKIIEEEFEDGDSTEEYFTEQFKGDLEAATQAYYLAMKNIYQLAIYGYIGSKQQ